MNSSPEARAAIEALDAEKLRRLVAGERLQTIDERAAVVDRFMGKKLVMITGVDV